ncbi:glycosyltransferase [Nostoc sp. CHAB 5844]|nr:glycosyltransferase [Nostoc sp. CHAB 5844]
MCLISVITPVYNGEAFIRETIESVLCQKGVEVEYIIVDDGSTDDTVQIVKEFPQIKLIQQSPKGANVARYTGLMYSSGHYISYLDADDYFTSPDVLNDMLNFYREYTFKENVIFFGRKVDYYENENKFFVNDFKKYNLNVDNKATLLNNNIQTSLPLYPALALRSMERFPSVSSRQELLINLALINLNYEFVEVDMLNVVIRHHGSAARISNKGLVIDEWTKIVKNLKLEITEKQPQGSNGIICLSRYFILRASEERRRRNWGSSFFLLLEAFRIYPLIVLKGFSIREILSLTKCWLVGR